MHAKQAAIVNNNPLKNDEIFNTAPAASKNDTRFKSGQNWLKNK